MASYHASVKTGGKGRAGKHADYITREGAYSPEQQKGKKLEDLECTASLNMPKWAEHDPSLFWKAADQHERKNGATYREFEIALPREMTPEQRKALVEDFIEKQLGNKHVVTYAIHLTKATIEGGEQPHAHIIYSEKVLDGIDRDPAQFFKRYNAKNPEKGGCEKDSAGTPERLLATKKLWADVQNAHLEKGGYPDRVTHLSLKAQGIDRQAERHLGPIDARKANAPVINAHREAQHELEITRRDVAAIDITAELATQARAAEQAREAIRQAQQTAAAAEQARAAAAEKAAAEQARADAQREADHKAEQIKQQQHAAVEAAAQAAHDREIQREKEDDIIRTATLDTLGKASRATEKSSRATGDNLQATSRDAEAGARVLLTAREHLRTGVRLADDYGENLGRALEGAERRQLGKYLDRCAGPVREKLGNVERVVREASRIFGNVVRTIATACQLATNFTQAITQAKKEIAAERASAGQRLDALITDMAERVVADRKAKEKAQEQPQQSTHEAAKAIAATNQEKPATVVLEQAQAKASPFETGLTTAADLHLAQRAKDLFSQVNPSYADRSELCRDVNQAVYNAQAARAASEPRRPNMQSIERTAKEAQNTRSRAAGEREPWPDGQSNCYWDTLVGMATREKRDHLNTPRPGFFWGDAKKTYDARTEELTQFIEKVGPASKALQRELQLDIAQRVATHAKAEAEKAPQHAANVLRDIALAKLSKAVQQADLAVPQAQKEKRRQLQRSPRDRGDRGKDFGL